MSEKELRKANKEYFDGISKALFEGFPIPGVREILTQVVSRWSLNQYTKGLTAREQQPVRDVNRPRIAEVSFEKAKDTTSDNNSS